jgi:hypothetical protein
VSGRDDEANLVAAGTPLSVGERRKFPRYRYSGRIIIRAANGLEVQGMSVEISECGMSAVTSAALGVGDLVEVEPISGGAVSAVVRRSLGRLCGFEFLNLGAEQAGKIREMCRMLPLYRSKTLDVWKD